MHRRVAARHEGPTLELGGGTLNHLKFERDLSTYDVVEPFTALWEDNPRRHDVRALYPTLADVPAAERYARVVSIAVLEHLEDLPAEIARCTRHLADDGVFQAGIPSQGGFLWWLGWRCTTGLSYWLRHGLDYGVFMRHEHLSTAPEIVACVESLFEEVSVRRFPLPLQHLSLYAYVEARRPRRDLAEALLAERARAA